VKALSDRNGDAVDDYRCQDKKVVDGDDNPVDLATRQWHDGDKDSRPQTFARAIIGNDFESYLGVEDGADTCIAQHIFLLVEDG